MLSAIAELVRYGGVTMYATTLIGSTTLLLGVLVCLGALNKRWLKLGVGLLIGMLCMSVSCSAFQAADLASVLKHGCFAAPEYRTGAVYDAIYSIAAMVSWATMFAALNAPVYGLAMAQRTRRLQPRP